MADAPSIVRAADCEQRCRVEMFRGRRCGRQIHPAPYHDENPVCLMHSNDPTKSDDAFQAEFDHILAEAERESALADFCRFVFPAADFQGKIFNPACSFFGASFLQDADFSLGTFLMPVDFRRVSFVRDASFGSTNFDRTVTFFRARFTGNAIFHLSKYAKNVNFSQVLFSEDANFDNADFMADSDFSSVHFMGNAGLSGSTFARSANFLRSRFANQADFPLARFKDKAIFNSAIFEKETSFRETTFEQFSDFYNCVFRELVDFTLAVFHKDVRFSESHFFEHVGFRAVKFSQSANFWRVTAEHCADFSWTSFKESTVFDESKFQRETNFHRATFDDAATFRNVLFRNNSSLGPSLVFTDVKIAHPEIIEFQSCDLSQALFYNTNVSEIDFTLIEWGHRSATRYYLFEESVDLTVADELKNGAESHDERNYALIAETYQQLKRNFDAKSDYWTAGHWHYGEMEMKRLHSRWKWKPLRWLDQNFSLIGLYRIASEYGENYVRPLSWLAFALFIFFPLLYPLIGFYPATGLALNPTDVHVSTALNHLNYWNYSDFFAAHPDEQPTGILGFFLHGLMTSLSVAGFQKELCYMPSYPWGRMLALFEILVTTTLGGLFALAIRRQFKRS